MYYLTIRIAKPMIAVKEYLEIFEGEYMISVPRVRVLTSVAEKVRRLEVGETLFLEGKTIKHASLQTNRASKVMPGRRYKCRTEDSGVRIYRVQ
jgi:uncharacterized protein with PhoU and TrkA domain